MLKTLFADLKFQGRGKVASADDRGRLVLRIDALTTQTRRLKPLIREFFRKEYCGARPGYEAAEVEILIEQPSGHRGFHDVDNVAKAVFDGLTGAVFKDDRQVSRLVVEKQPGERPRIWVRAGPRG